MSQITSHVLDTSRGKPASGIKVSLFQLDKITANDQQHWLQIGQGITNKDGRVSDLVSSDDRLPAGSYRVNFAIASYFDGFKEQAFYPYVDIVFNINSEGDHYHIPLLLSAFGYSTYRGS